MVFFLLLLGFGLRLVNLDQSFWLDEAAQVIESSRPLLAQFDLSSDFHPPLFHLLLHYWMYLGTSEMFVRILSVLFGILSLYFTYKVAEQLLGKKTAIMALLFMAIAPYHIWYSQETRPYMLFVVTSIASLHFLSNKKWFAYTITLILMLYSLYFAPFVMFGQISALLFVDRKSLVKCLRAVGIAAIAFTPWFPSFLHQLSVGTSGSLIGWTDVVSVAVFKVIPLTFAKFIYGRGSIENNLLYGLLIFPVFSVFVYGIYKAWEQKKGRLLVIIFALSLTSAWIVSLMIPIIAPQRLIFLLPLFYIFVAYALESIPTYAVKRLLFIVVVFISIAGIIDYYINPSVQREQWRQSVRFVESSAKTAVAVFAFSEPFAPWLWYSQNKVVPVSLAPNFIVTAERLKEISPVIDGQQMLFYFHYLDELTDPNGLSEQYFLQHGFVELSIKDFPGVGFITVYEKVNTQN